MKSGSVVGGDEVMINRMQSHQLDSSMLSLVLDSSVQHIRVTDAVDARVEQR